MVSYRSCVTGFSLFLLGAMLTTGGAASAQVMDFNTLATGLTVQSSYTENGITLKQDDVNSTFDTVVGANSTTGAYFHTSTTAGPTGGTFGTSFTFSKGGTSFSLLSIDLVAGFGAPVEYIASNGKTLFTAASGIRVFGSDFTNITSFQQITSASGHSTVTIDDVTLGAPTPEPGAYALLASSLLTSAGFIVRRRRNAYKTI